MAADYTKFKTPFFEIEVGDPSWSRTVKLPHHILRLVSKVEITETMMVDDSLQPSSITITFIEGSREPASPDYKMGTSGLYQIPSDGDSIDMDIAGSLTNRSGIITDLRFSGNHGITFLTEQEKKTGRVDNRIQKNVQGKNVTRKHKDEKSSPMFLFQQRNLVKVTWGYLEDPKTIRSKTLSIVNIATNFPESGMPTTTVTCSSSFMLMNQIASKDGLSFQKTKTVKKDGHDVEIHEDIPLKDVLEDISKKAGMKAIISDDLINPTIDKHAVKSIPAGETVAQFIARMARASGCFYEIKPDPKTGKDVLYFISKKDMHTRSIILDNELLNWKGPGSILKSVNVAVDFAGLIGSQLKGMTPDGQVQSEDIMVSERVFVNAKSPETNKKQEVIPADPTTNNAHKTTENVKNNVFGGNATGTVEYHPAQSTEKIQNNAHVKSDEQLRLVQINFSTIGYTKLMPGVMQLSGIGVRYSGKYRVISVTHIIDGSGYITNCQGTSSFLGAGGVKVTDIKSQKEQEEMVPERVFEQNTKLGQYQKINSGG